MKKQPQPTVAPEELHDAESESDGDELVVEGPTFESLGLAPKLLATLKGMGFERPTPIQESAIPALLEGRDLVGQARTGTGKTAAFGLPLITRLSKARGRGLPRAIVLTPTRELALQVTEALITFAASTPLMFLTVYGGAAYGPQLRGLREGVDVVVGTPGRVIDLIERGNLLLGEVQVVVLDEADEMLEMGFIEAVETILAQTPEATRQVALFSATMPQQIRKVAERYLKDPVNIRDASQTVVAIEQRFVQVPPRFKREALYRILRSEVRGATLVFASTRIACAEAADALAVNGIPAEALHGDLSQPARERVIELLRARRVEVVVATDIAARGIDIEHLTHIINLDLPKNIEIYTHRIGRTGRAGRSGKAITLVVPREAGRFADALRRRGVMIEEMFLASEHALAMRQRAVTVEEMTTLGAEGSERAPVIEDARRWVAELTKDGSSAEEIAARALALLGDARNLRLGQVLDKGLPPWARQQQVMVPTNAPRAAAPHTPRPAPTHAPRSRTVVPEASAGPVPQGEGFCVIGVGRHDGVRPADLVGALTNELGLTGRDVGRVEIRDAVSVIGVPAAFVARLGDDAWPLTIRRIETTLKRYDEPAPTRAPRPRPPAHAVADASPAEVAPPAKAHAKRPTPERDAREVRPPREDREAHPPREDREVHPPREAREAHPPREAREAHPPREAREAHPPREAREVRQPREDRGPPEPREVRQPRDDRGPHEPREARPSRPSRESTGDERPRWQKRAEPAAAGESPARGNGARHHDNGDRPPQRSPRAEEPRRPAAVARPHAAHEARDTREPRRPAAAARPHESAPRPHERRPAPGAPAAHEPRRPNAASAAEARRPTKRPPVKSAGDRPPRRAVDVAPRVPRTAR